MRKKERQLRERALETFGDLNQGRRPCISCKHYVANTWENLIHHYASHLTKEGEC